MLIIICALIGLIVLIFSLLFLVQGAPYVPSADAKTKLMTKAVENNKSVKILDMGCGDGKLVIAVAQLGYRVDGIELNPWLVFRARKSLKQLHLSDKAQIFWGSFWSFDTSGYDTILLYAIAHIMPKLETKLKNELRPGSRIISNYYKFPNLKPVKSTGSIHIYISERMVK